MTDKPLYLLDVNALVALSLPHHVHHDVVTDWFEHVDYWATCSVTQSAYVRLLLNPAVVGFNIPPADVITGLQQLVAVSGHQFIVDDACLSEPIIDFSVLVGSKQVTDLHLVDLAAKHEAVLATVDQRLPAALAPTDRQFVYVIDLP